MWKLFSNSCSRRFCRATTSLSTRILQCNCDQSDCQIYEKQLLLFRRKHSLCDIAGKRKQNGETICFHSPRHNFRLSHKYKSAMDVPAGIFQGSVDRFNGITVESTAEIVSAADFAEKLQKSLEYWRSTGRRAIWFKVSTAHAEWIPHLTQNGFDFHHAKTGYVMLQRWLPTDEYVNIPDFAHTLLGVGGLVINAKDEVLVITDRYALIPNSWKLPGGYVNPREDLVDAAIREVHEETGINCQFKTVISLRHAHSGYGFGCSDIYCVIGLTPINLDLQPCEREIARIRWMPVAEFLEHPQVHETNRQCVRTYLDYQRRSLCFTYEVHTHQVLKKEYRLYFLKPVDEETQK